MTAGRRTPRGSGPVAAQFNRSLTTPITVGWIVPSSSPPSAGAAPLRTRWSAPLSSTHRDNSPARAITQPMADPTPRSWLWLTPASGHGEAPSMSPSSPAHTTGKLRPASTPSSRQACEGWWLLSPNRRARPAVAATTCAPKVSRSTRAPGPSSRGPSTGVGCTGSVTTVRG